MNQSYSAIVFLTKLHILNLRHVLFHTFIEECSVRALMNCRKIKKTISVFSSLASSR